MDNPFAAEGSRKVEQYDIKDGILLFDVAVQVFYRFLRIAFDYRIGTFPDLFMLPVEGHFEKITFLHAFYVPVTHPGDAVLGGVAIHDTHLQTFLVVKDTGHQNCEGRLSDSSFLAGKGN